MFGVRVSGAVRWVERSGFVVPHPAVLFQSLACRDRGWEVVVATFVFGQQLHLQAADW